MRNFFFATSIIAVVTTMLSGTDAITLQQPATLESPSQELVQVSAIDIAELNELAQVSFEMTSEITDQWKSITDLLGGIK